MALFACALCPDSALDILEGLSEPERSQARDYARKVVGWDSPSRQAKLTVEFGTRQDAGQRLASLMADAAPALRLELFRLLPSYHRSLFPELAQQAQAPAPPAPPGLLALAARLVREATR